MERRTRVDCSVAATNLEAAHEGHGSLQIQIEGDTKQACSGENEREGGEGH